MKYYSHFLLLSVRLPESSCYKSYPWPAYFSQWELSLASIFPCPTCFNGTCPQRTCWGPFQNIRMNLLAGFYSLKCILFLNLLFVHKHLVTWAYSQVLIHSVPNSTLHQ